MVQASAVLQLRGRSIEHFRMHFFQIVPIADSESESQWQQKQNRFSANEQLSFITNGLRLSRKAFVQRNATLLAAIRIAKNYGVTAQICNNMRVCPSIVWSVLVAFFVRTVFRDQRSPSTTERFPISPAFLYSVAIRCCNLAYVVHRVARSYCIRV